MGSPKKKKFPKSKDYVSHLKDLLASGEIDKLEFDELVTTFKIRRNGPLWNKKYHI